jgi:hypothetical protein
LEKDASFDINQTNIAFWETFTTAFLDFEKDAKTVYAAIYSLGLKDAEKIISKLDSVYISFIKELAENHVLGISSEAIDYLITSKNSTFEKEVQFFTDLEKAIAKVERKRIKTELPKTFDKLSFEISDDAIALAIKKKERKALKEKMNAWDAELVINEEVTVYSVTAKKTTRVIPLYFMKYAATVCVYLSVSVQYFKFSSNTNFIQTEENSFVTASAKEDTITPEIPLEALAEVVSVTNNATVFESGMGVASNAIKITENNQKARMASIVTAIEKYRQLLEKEFSENKVSVNSRVNELESKISSLQKEWDLLKEREKQYNFDGTELVLYVSTAAKVNFIILDGDSYYLKRDSDFYKLTIATQPQLYKKISDTNLINNLEDILSENGK